MSAKHTFTAGPWDLCEVGDYADFDGRSRVILDGGMTQRIAVVHVSDEEGDANARLIAAAPELLLALETLVSLSGDENATAVDEGNAWAQARAAIAKATGEEGR
jgi:hypothetical protein